MILTGSEITSEVENGNIIIDPFDKKNVNPNSYNYRLYNILKVPEGFDNDGKPTFSTVEIDQKGYILKPHQMYLASTYETIGSDKYMISLIGRSSMGRLGLFLQIAANIGHTGTCHKWTLELVCTKPLKIYPFMQIGQVSFWLNKGEISDYTGRYKEFNSPQESLFIK